MDFELLKKVTYLDSASAGIIPQQVADSAIKYYQEHQAYGDIPWDSWLDKVEQSRDNVAMFLNCENNELSFQANTGTCMNIVTSFFEKGDEIILNDIELPTSNLPWLGKGFNLKYVKSRDHKIYIDDIEKEITRETKAIVISRVNTFTGYKIDLKRLSSLCKAKGVKLIINASQGIGAYKLDLESLDIDFCVFTGYKRLLAGYGIACLYVNRRNFGTQKYEIFNGWMSSKHPHDVINTYLDSKNDARKFDIGSPHFAGIFSIGEATKYLQNIGIEVIERKINELSNYLIQNLKRLGINITSPIENVEEISGIIYIKPKNFKKVKQKMIKDNIYVVSYDNGIRISLHFYNNKNDIDTLISFLDK